MSLKVMTMCFDAQLKTPTKVCRGNRSRRSCRRRRGEHLPLDRPHCRKGELVSPDGAAQLRKLEEEGLIVVLSEGGTRGKDTREWRFDLEKLAALIPVIRGQNLHPSRGASHDR